MLGGRSNWLGLGSSAMELTTAHPHPYGCQVTGDTGDVVGWGWLGLVGGIMPANTAQTVAPAGTDLSGVPAVLVVENQGELVAYFQLEVVQLGRHEDVDCVVGRIKRRVVQRMCSDVPGAASVVQPGRRRVGRIGGRHDHERHAVGDLVVWDPCGRSGFFAVATTLRSNRAKRKPGLGPDRQNARSLGKGYTLLHEDWPCPLALAPL